MRPQSPKRSIRPSCPVSSPETAEAVKLTENIFRSVNIALVNELKIVYAAMGIDVWEVIEAAKTKPFGFMPFYPGPGLGGHCIPIDPFYLTWKAREYELSTRFIELAGEINTAMPRYVVSRIADELDARAGKGLNRHAPCDAKSPAGARQLFGYMSPPEAGRFHKLCRRSAWRRTQSILFHALHSLTIARLHRQPPGPAASWLRHAPGFATTRLPSRLGGSGLAPHRRRGRHVTVRPAREEELCPPYATG
jgi:hypothetical protein